MGDNTKDNSGTLSGQGGKTEGEKGYGDGKHEANAEISSVAHDISEVVFGKPSSDYEQGREAGYQDAKDGDTESKK